MIATPSAETLAQLRTAAVGVGSRIHGVFGRYSPPSRAANLGGAK